jgi:predicted DNA-binding transcriptional regulator YafY
MNTSPLDETLLALIPEVPGHVTTPELHAMVKRHAPTKPPTPRTIQRRLEYLLDAKLDLVRVDSKPHRWSWRAGTKRNGLTRMDPATALAFGMLEQHLHDLIPAPFRDDLTPLFRKADDIVQAIPHARLKRWKARTTTASSAFPLQLPKLRSDVLRSVQDALLDRTQLVLSYRRAGDDEPSEYDVHPQGLLLVDGVFYLVATVDEYTDLLQFALHRIERASATTMTSRDAPGFDASRYVCETQALQFPSGMTGLRLRVRGFLSLHLQERPLSEDQTMRQIDEDWWELRATVPESQQLEWWLRWFGAQVEVLAPARLRLKMAANAHEVDTIYAPDLQK